MVDLLPEIDVVPDDPFNSSPTDTNLMGPTALQAYRNGDPLPTGRAKTPLVLPSALVMHIVTMLFAIGHADTLSAAQLTPI